MKTETEINPRAELQNGIADLDWAISQVHMEAEELTERLGPVLSPLTPAPVVGNTGGSAVSAPPCESAMANKIHALTEKLKGIRLDLINLRDRVRV